MKNKELLNICYKFFNRYITVKELLKELKKLDTQKLSEKEQKEIKNIIKEIEKIDKEYPNKEDEFTAKKKESIKNLLDKLGQLPEDEEIFKKSVENLEKEYKKEIDSHERWFNVTKSINDNKYFNACFESLTPYELLEFIAQYIKAPFPPQLTQEEFDILVKVGKEKDEREWLWRLAFNYEGFDKDYNEIVDYYMEKKDAYYLSELISSVGECLNINRIIYNLKDKDLIKDLIERKDVIKHYVTEEQIKKLEAKLKD